MPRLQGRILVPRRGCFQNFRQAPRPFHVGVAPPPPPGFPTDPVPTVSSEAKPSSPTSDVCGCVLSQDPFGDNEGTFDYTSIKERLENIKKSIDAEKPSGSDLDGSPYHEEDETEWSIKQPVVTTTKNPKPEIEDWVGFLYEED